MTITRLLILTLLMLAASSNSAFALAGAWQGDEAIQVRLIAGVDGVGDLATVPLGLEVKLAPDWHTYWRSPGMAGLPPQFDWQKSQNDEANLKQAVLLYPAPKRYTAFGLETVGYRDNVVFPIDAELRAAGKALAVETNLDILICSQLCVPKHFALSLTIPAGPATPGAEAATINQYRDQVPGDAQKASINIKDVANDGQSVTVTIAAQAPLDKPDIFVENDKNIEFGAPVVSLAPDKMSATFTVKPVMPLPDDVKLGTLPLTFTVVDGTHALEQKAGSAPVAQPSVEPAPVENPISLGLVMFFAVIGGFILNLMPCVLPVLSLKILSVVSHGGGTRHLVRHSFLVTAAGIMFSFLALALVTIALKALGLAVGWGVQFQQPMFLGLLIIVLTFFAANMWGLFEIRLPRFLADSLTGPYHPKLAGDFATGAFATLLATPCTAPFLGTAVGFALASGPRNILLIFACLGFGMTLPYLAVALFPRMAVALPRPGVWMMHLRHLLGWALALTALWLIWVLAAQISARGAFVVGICMLGVLGLFALRSIRPRAFLAFGIASFALLAFGTTLAGTLAPHPSPAIDPSWQPFDEAALLQDVADGKTVFVDVTADWCLTCKANMKFVLSQDAITRRLFHTDIIAMQADWTSPNAVIAAFLQKHGRYGIPFNVVFGPGAKLGLVLPELLTAQQVLEALEAAAKTPSP